MTRKTQDKKLETIYNKVREKPGERPGSIARLLGLNRSEVTRMLPALEDKGLYITEDEQGGLWPYRYPK